ncbi:MAG: metallophosphoesterase family protein, partial [Bacteroidota bacterium]
MRWFFFFAIAMFPCIAISQIAAGPMLGYCEMKEALVWIQTEGSQNISIQYSVRGNNWITSEEITTGSPSAYTHKFILSPLEPGFSYTYRFLIDGKPLTDEYTLTTQKLWQHREDPPEFTFFTGSCAFINEPQYDRPGKGYGKSKDIFLKMAEMNPDMMLWLGDNVYLREPDWTSWSGFMHRYSHTRQQPELQPLLAACPHFAIWDDHDFGPNDSNRSWIHKDWSQDAF